MTSRPMSPHLRAILDGLSAEDRRHILQLSTTPGLGDLTRRLVAGFAAQILADDAAEVTILHALSEDHRRELEAIDRRVNRPLPQAEGRAAEVDPGTGEVLGDV